MLDQCIIRVVGDRVQVKPDIISSNDFLLDGWLKCQRSSRDHDAKHAPQEMGLRYHSSFEIFADRALVVHTRSRESKSPDRTKQYVSKIEFNPSKILHGQNGITISDSRSLCAAITIMRHAMAHLLVNPDDVSTLIPGLTKRKSSFWYELEIALDIKDPDSAILKQVQYMQSPYIRNPSVVYPESVYLNGTSLKLKAYDKIEERGKRFGKKSNKVQSSADNITRLEVELRNGTIPNGFPDHRSTIRLTEIHGHKRLTGFTWEDLRAIHRTYFGGIKGVYHAKTDKSCGYNTGIAAAMAAIAKDHNIPTREFRQALEQYGGKSKESSRDTEKKMLKFMEHTSEIEADTILSDEAYEHPPLTAVSDLEGCRFYVELYGLDHILGTSDKVLDVYTQNTDTNVFTPVVTDHKYWLPSAFTALVQPTSTGGSTEG